MDHDEIKIGDVVVFVDGNGRKHNALVIWVFTGAGAVNIVYVANPGVTPPDNLQHHVSIPLEQPGMTGFYVKPQPYKR